MNVMGVQLLGRVGTLETAGCWVGWSISTIIPEACAVECSLMLVVSFCVLECSVLAFCMACQTHKFLTSVDIASVVLLCIVFAECLQTFRAFVPLAFGLLHWCCGWCLIVFSLFGRSWFAVLLFAALLFMMLQVWEIFKSGEMKKQLSWFRDGLWVNVCSFITEEVNASSDTLTQTLQLILAIIIEEVWIHIDNFMHSFLQVFDKVPNLPGIQLALGQQHSGAVMVHTIVCNNNWDSFTLNFINVLGPVNNFKAA